jgi:3-dehydroquinate synthase
MLEIGCTRHSVLFAVGGGVIGDITGLAAALALRGIDFVQIPTTLLAQVDSSVGGKTGINTPRGKNLVGAFYQPKAVAIDLETISTLPLRERQAGYAEVVKYGLLGNSDFYAWLEKNGQKVLDGEPEALAKAIETSCQMKADIVRQDEREETGLRALLNLGHSFGHAIETAAGYDGRILHGEAVGIGLVLAARLSARLGKINQSDAERVRNHLSSVGMKTEISDIAPHLLTTPEELLRLMGKDKKNTSEGLVFVLLQSIGQAALCKGVDTSLVLETLRESI